MSQRSYPITRLSLQKRRPDFRRRANFWKAGASGKHSEAARRSGVVGTFGIGAMANFGVCDQLIVETRAEGTDVVLRSTAEKALLQIGSECIELTHIESARPVGTTVTVRLESSNAITLDRARAYLDPYVNVLPVPVYLNDELVSGSTLLAKLPTAGRGFHSLDMMTLSDNLSGGEFEVQADANGQVLVLATKVLLAGAPVEGSMALLQSGGPLMALRSSFGLAPVPAIGTYGFGGFADLSYLQPTAGREALSRESIEQITRLVALCERAVSEVLARTTWADRNTSFLQWILSHGRHDLAGRVSVQALPEGIDIELGSVTEKTSGKTVHYYAGNDRLVLKTFANEQSTLLHVSPNNPCRTV